MGIDAYMIGIQPAVTENRSQLVKIIPGYTENPTLEDIFAPPTMDYNKTVPYGPELYMPSSHSNNYTGTSPSSLSLSSVSSRSGSVVSFFSEVNVSALSFDKVNNHHHGQDQANLSSSSGYQSSSILQSTSSESNPLGFLSSLELDNVVYGLSAI